MGPIAWRLAEEASDLRSWTLLSAVLADSLDREQSAAVTAALSDPDAFAAIVAAADESRDARVSGAPEPAPPPSAVDVQKLFSGLTVQRTAHGGLVIEAPPETAATLAALFAGMAQLLQAVPGPAS